MYWEKRECDIHGDDLLSKGITMESDADVGDGRFSRKERLSFRDSRREEQSSRSAAELRAESVPVSAFENVDVDLGEEKLGEFEESNSDSDVEVGFEEALMNVFQDVWWTRKDVEEVASWDTQDGVESLVRVRVRGRVVFAVVEIHRVGVVFGTSVKKYGFDLSILGSGGVDAEFVRDVVAKERRLVQRMHPYRDPGDLVNELSCAEADMVVDAYEEVVNGVLMDVLVGELSVEEVEFSVVDGYVVAGGVGVSRLLHSILVRDGVLSDDQWGAVEESLSLVRSGFTDGFPARVRDLIEEFRDSGSGVCVVGRIVME